MMTLVQMKFPCDWFESTTDCKNIEEKYTKPRLQAVTQYQSSLFIWNRSSIFHYTMFLKNRAWMHQISPHTHLKERTTWKGALAVEERKKEYSDGARFLKIRLTMGWLGFLLSWAGTGNKPFVEQDVAMICVTGVLLGWPKECLNGWFVNHLNVFVIKK